MDVIGAWGAPPLRPKGRRFDLDPEGLIPYSPAMNHNTRKYGVGPLAVLIALSVLTFWESRGCAQQAQLQAQPREGVLVLRNGQVFRGMITQVGDRHIVALNGGQISVKSSEVEVCCASLEEAYRLRQQYSPCESALDHLQLAQWCQHQGLLEAANQELAEAKRLDPSHPMIPLLERRLKTLRDGVEPRGPIAKVPESQLPAHDLDRLVRNMPAGTMESFTQIVQPMLMNNCTTSGCHGPGASGTFSLARVSPSGSTGRRVTQRNLQTVLQWVDRDNPGASPLLAEPLRPHGTAKGPIFVDPQVAQYQQLVNWVYRVSQMSGPGQAVMQASHVERNKVAHQASPAAYTTPAAQVLSGVQTLGGEDLSTPEMPGEENLLAPTTGMEGALDVSSTQPAPSRFDRPGVKRGTLPKEFTPVDPFDPQVFNRQFFPGESGSSDSMPQQ